MPSPFQTRQIARTTANYTTVKAISADTTLTDADSGKLIAVDNSAANVTITLPTPVAGHTFTIILSKTAAAKNLLVNAASSANYYKGGLLYLDSDDTDAQTYTSSPNGTSEYRVDMDDPAIGSNFTIVSDGTYWYWYGQVSDSGASPNWS
tara:strand:+ start:112 stop:561 length:450 start_codon:yes stop_codon:yes gene_type:complete